MTTLQPPVVEMTGIDVTFPGVKALDGVDLRLRAGEVHALLGENGAGKSTLIKALTGVYSINGGRIVVAGEERTFSGPAQAQQAGISTVYQEINLCGNLSVAENMLLGREPRRWGRVDGKRMHARAAELLERMHLSIDPASTLSTHPIAIQQLVAVARATDVEAKVLILDEPTSSLDADEVAELFRVIRELKDEGTAVLFVSHFLDQVYEISDRMTVLRNGRLVGEYKTSELPQFDLVAKMIGHDLETLEAVDRATQRKSVDVDKAPVLSARELGRGTAIAPMDLDVHEGEVVGLAGLLGSGRTEFARLLFGADHADHGELFIDGEKVSTRSPLGPIGKRVAFCSEDRKAEGVIDDLSIRDNLVLAMQAARGWSRPIPTRTKDEIVTKYMDMLDIKPRNPDALMRDLSGGNQQKVLLARWLLTEPRLLILDEPTRGIDVGAKAQIQKLVADLSAEGMSVVFISAELEEVLRTSDRVLVLKDRRKVAELADQPSMDDVMQLIAAGGTGQP
jgi:monosaccharide-transporting ATPase